MSPKSSFLQDAFSSIEDVSSRILPSDVSSHPDTDSASDNETGERPVREKLKKASIASRPMDSSIHTSTGGGTDENNDFGRANSFTKPERTPSLARNFDASSNGCPAWAERNQLIAGLTMGGKYETYISENEAKENYSSIRKDSFNIHLKNLHEEAPTEALMQVAGPDNDQSSPDHNVTRTSSQAHITVIDSDILPLSKKSSDDLEMGHASFGPRKKRSRDQLDPDIDREQKIVATEEAKAQRRSEEHERDALDIIIATDAEIERGTSSAGSQCDEREIKKYSNSATTGVYVGFCPFLVGLSLTQLQVHLGDTSMASSSSHQLAIPQTTVSAPHLDPFNCKDTLLARSSTSKTSSSGFTPLPATSLPSSSNEDFPSKISRIKPLDASVDASRNGNRSEKTSMPEEEVAPNSPASNTPPRAGAIQDPTLSSLGPSGFSSLGSGVFGTGFGQAFHNGTKLSSFAAPVGDAKWGDQGGSTNLFGSPAKDEEEDNSESEEDGPIDTENNDESYEVMTRFQQQDGNLHSKSTRQTADIGVVDTGEEGEETVFSSARASLFSWDGAAWKEGGKGVFKLNLTFPRVESSEHTLRSGRFIMRAHQTFRVLLNTPIFKQMKVGDSKGNQPSSKTLSFSVVEKGKPTPYLIRVSQHIPNAQNL